MNKISRDFVLVYSFSFIADPHLTALSGYCFLFPGLLLTYLSIRYIVRKKTTLSVVGVERGALTGEL